jgi:ribonuclease G
MSGLELLADEIDGRLHVAILRKGRLDDLYVDAIDRTAAWASVYIGKITRIDQKLDAAFVDLGNGLTGFLPAKHVHYMGADPSETRTGIATLVKPGQMLLVQIKSEPKRATLHENHKLPRLTTKIYCMGQFLLYCPISSQVTMSRQISNENVIKISARLKGKGGWIIQKTAEFATEDELHAETRQLLNEWQYLQEQAKTDKPQLLRQGPDALARAFGDYGAYSFEHVHAGSKELLDRIIAWSNRFAPALPTSKRLKLFRPVSAADKLFEMNDTFSAIAALADPVVPLGGGGSLIVEQTHAIAVMDVNQGGAGTASSTNIEAAHESMRHLRLRGISGAILVDFINMHQKSERFRLVEMLEKMCGDDFASAQVHGFTRLGIIEISRKRRSAALAEKMRY